MIRVFLLINLIILLWSCTSEGRKKKITWEKPNETSQQHEQEIPKPKYDSIQINDSGLVGYFKGPEFNDDGDVGHQFSNTVARIVGNYLKEAYKKQHYLKVDFKNLKVTTKGLNQKDSVTYTMKMPFVTVKKCQAFTGIEHCGSWDNQPLPELNERLTKLKTNLRTRYSLGRMEQTFLKTPEGFVEYWVQFKHKDYQSECF